MANNRFEKIKEIVRLQAGSLSKSSLIKPRFAVEHDRIGRLCGHLYSDPNYRNGPSPFTS